MGIERVLMLLDSEGIEIPEPRWYDVFVTYMGDHREAAWRLVQTLRDGGLKADMDHCGRSLKAQFKYANKTGAPLTATIGDSEAEARSFRLKKMATGEETTVPEAEAVKTIREWLES